MLQRILIIKLVVQGGHVVCLWQVPGGRIVVLTATQGLQFPGMEYFKDKVAEQGFSFTDFVILYVKAASEYTLHSLQEGPV